MRKGPSQDQDGQDRTPVPDSIFVNGLSKDMVVLSGYNAHFSPPAEDFFYHRGCGGDMAYNNNNSRGQSKLPELLSRSSLSPALLHDPGRFPTSPSRTLVRVIFICSKMKMCGSLAQLKAV